MLPHTQPLYGPGLNLDGSNSTLSQRGCPHARVPRTVSLNNHASPDLSVWLSLEGADRPHLLKLTQFKTSQSPLVSNIYHSQTLIVCENVGLFQAGTPRRLRPRFFVFRWAGEDLSKHFLNPPHLLVCFVRQRKHC